MFCHSYFYRARRRADFPQISLWEKLARHLVLGVLRIICRVLMPVVGVRQSFTTLSVAVVPSAIVARATYTPLGSAERLRLSPPLARRVPSAE